MNNDYAYYYLGEYNIYAPGGVPITYKSNENGQLVANYKIQDYLGNVRAVINQDKQITGLYDYMPFGEQILVPPSGTKDRLSFIGKENDVESGLGDFGVRKYDGAAGRFLSIDPLWEKYYAWSPYHYCRNNPINRVDANGFRDDGYSFGIGMYLANANAEDSKSFLDGIMRAEENQAKLVIGAAGLGFGMAALGTGVVATTVAVITIPMSMYEVSYTWLSIWHPDIPSDVSSTFTGAVVQSSGGDKKTQNDAGLAQAITTTSIDLVNIKNNPVAGILSLMGLCNSIQDYSQQNEKSKDVKTNSKSKKTLPNNSQVYERYKISPLP